MFFRLILAASLALALQADDHWMAVKSGPFQVFTNGADRGAREKLMYLEQFREALRVITGRQDLGLVWPVRVLVFKNARQMPVSTAHFALGRNARMEAVAESAAFSRESLKELARILLYENTTRLPQPIEEGLIELMSTLEVDGTRITLGAPVPEAERSHGWALMQLVTVNPEYSGRSRVMISNLEQSGDFEAASKNAFEKTAAQMNQQADAYLKAGNFATGSVSGRAVSMTRDFKPMQLDADAGEVALADLALANGSAQAEQAFTRLHGAAAAEGLGLLALKQRKDNEARRLFESAVASGSDSARAFLEAARLEPDTAKARADLKKASELNPRWGQPYFQMGELDQNVPEQRAVDLKKAASLDARNIDYWQALARTEIAARNYPEAQKAWAGAERAAANDEERARIHQVRLQVEQERADYEAAERKRIADERERDIQRVKSQSEASIHAAEEEARKKLNPEGAPAPKDAVWMDELKGNAAVDGVFERLDCIAKQARMVIKTADGKTVQLLIGDPSQIVLGGGGEKTFGCGVQQGARRVHVEYNPKTDAKLKTTGEVTAIEFR
ncbi:MAG: hypothetical protein LAP38_24775 [Acidobacteriia bacterium]|nr:hypothetical protein [Terriglobia bacterium]